MIRRALLAALLALALVLPAGADPAGNQLVSWSTLCTGITEGVFTALSGTPSQCTSSPNRIITWAQFVAAVQSSGCGSGNPLPYWSQLVACRTTGGGGGGGGTTTINATTDPWLTNGATDWPNTGGVFATLPGSAVPGQPGGAQYFSSTSGAGSIKQTISPSSIAATTQITVRAYILRQQTVEGGYSDSGCTTTHSVTASSTGTLAIYTSAGSLVTSTSAPFTTSYAQATATVAAPSTGTYVVEITVAPASASYTIYVKNVHGQCVANSGTAYAQAYATDITASNT